MTEERRPDIGHSLFREYTWRELKGAGYKYYDSSKDKKGAQEIAKRLRRKGNTVRVAKIGNRWYVLRKSKPVMKRVKRVIKRR